MKSPELSEPRHFDLVIVGAGSGNSIVDERFADLEVAIVDKGIGERGSYGGTCLNAGCIPTKMMVVPADLATEPNRSAKLGVHLGCVSVDFPAIRDRIFTRIDAIADGGLAWRQQNPNVTVLQEAARFINAHTLRVGADVITGERIVVAAGSRPNLPPIGGLDDPYLAKHIHTSESIMRVDELPRRLIILGGGVEAAEFAHVFAAFGSEVTVIHRGERLLKRDDAEMAGLLTEQLSERVALRLNQNVAVVEASPEGGLQVVAFDPAAMQYTYTCDALLVCAGRIPNGDLLHVERAGIEVDASGFVVVDEHQRTSVDHIWALGDVTSPLMLKHVANHEARVVQHNLLHPDDLVTSDHRFVPHTVFSSPELASVGFTEEELSRMGIEYVVGRCRYADVAYGWAMEDTDHLAKVLVSLDGDLLGGHILGPEATALLQPVVQALHFPVKVRDLARGQYWAHPGLPELLENALLDAVRQLDAL